ncbi:hypothetical protein Tco_1215106 [Tanacetum coccineum]
MESQEAILSKFKADFKQQQSAMTNKIDTVFKAITDRIAGARPSDTVKNPKLNVNSTSPVLFARSYPTVDPQCSTQIYGNRYSLKDKNKAKTDKTEHENGKSGHGTISMAMIARLGDQDYLMAEIEDFDPLTQQTQDQEAPLHLFYINRARNQAGRHRR